MIQMDDKKRASEISERLKNKYPDAKCSLDAEDDAWKLLVMARLSAQCTDEKVNKISYPLFSKFPDAKTMADAPQEEIEEIIRPCGLFRGKAKSIKEASHIIAYELCGKVPDTMEGLLALPGVGRKIANLIMGDVYGKGGIVADTHCIRICGKLGFYSDTKKDPVLCEKVMSKLIDESEQSDFCHRIVMFGREVCTARSPRCSECPLRDLCKTANTEKEVK